MAIPENPSRDESENPEQEEKKSSGRLVCTAGELRKDTKQRSLVMESFLQQLPTRLEQHRKSSIWQTLGALLSCKREVEIKYDFLPTENATVTIKVGTYCRELALEIFKKCRFPEDASSERNEQYCIKVAERVVDLLVNSEHRVDSASELIDLGHIEQNINTNENIFIKRLNNWVGRLKLPSEVVGEYIRPRVKEDPQARERDEIIFHFPEVYVMVYFFQHVQEKLQDLSDLEVIHLYHLFFDPRYKDQRIRFIHEGEVIDERVRFLLHEGVRYATAITYFGIGEPENKEWEHERRNITRNIVKTIYDVVLSGVFAPKRKSKRLKKYPETMEHIAKSFGKIVMEPEQYEELDDSIKLESSTKSWKLPEHNWDALRTKLERASKKLNMHIIGLFNLLIANKASSPSAGESARKNES